MNVDTTPKILTSVLQYSDVTVPDGCCWIFLSLCPLLSTQILPFKDEIPIKATPQVGWCSNVLKSIHAYHINDWRHNTCLVLDRNIECVILSTCVCACTCTFMCTTAVYATKSCFRLFKNWFHAKFSHRYFLSDLKVCHIDSFHLLNIS